MADKSDEFNKQKSATTTNGKKGFSTFTWIKYEYAYMTYQPFQKEIHGKGAGAADINCAEVSSERDAINDTISGAVIKNRHNTLFSDLE